MHDHDFTHGVIFHTIFTQIALVYIYLITVIHVFTQVSYNIFISHMESFFTQFSHKQHLPGLQDFHTNFTCAMCETGPSFHTFVFFTHFSYLFHTRHDFSRNFHTSSSCQELKLFIHFSHNFHIMMCKN